MSVNLLTPFTMVNRRSVPVSLDESGNPITLLTGRFVAINSSGQAVLPAAGQNDVYLVLEGTEIHIGTGADYTNSGGGYASTDAVVLPSVQASNAVALAYGSFNFTSGSESVDPTAGSALADQPLVAVDIYGRLVGTTQEDGNAVGKVEMVSTDSNGVNSVTIHMFGN